MSAQKRVLGTSTSPRIPQPPLLCRCAAGDLRPRFRRAARGTQAARSRASGAGDCPTARRSASAAQPIEGFRTGAPSRADAVDRQHLQSRTNCASSISRVSKLLGGEPVAYVVELKIDGVAMSLTYENGCSPSAPRAATASRATTSRTISRPSTGCRSQLPEKIRALRSARRSLHESRRSRQAQPRPRRRRAWSRGPIRAIRRPARSSCSIRAKRAKRHLRLFAYALGAC